MRFDASQHMRMGQHMKLAPRMIQSMEILQMPLLQLEERVAQELESNVTLEAGEADPQQDGDATATAGTPVTGPENVGEPDADRPMKVDEGSATDDFARLDSFEQSNPELAENEYSAAGTADVAPASEDFDRFQRTRLDGEPDAKSEAMANTASRPESLIEQLQEQWSLTDVDEALRPLGEQIIAFIEGDGYLRTPLETIIERMPATMARPTVEQMERALQAVQLLLEPAGVAARDIRECLLLQIDALEQEEAAVRGRAIRSAAATHADDREHGGTHVSRNGHPAGVGSGREAGAGQDPDAGWGLVRVLVENHLDDLSQNRLPRIVERTGLSMEAVKRGVERMRLLSLAPARALVQERPSAIVPDAVVEFDHDQDRYIAYLNDSRLPSLRINREYAKLARDREAPRETREFIRKNLSNATWLIDAVEQRRRTVLRVIRVVVDAQRDYFDYGPQALKPLPMTQVAEQLGVHVATVSRAVAEKYLQTPRGIVPLRGFFTGGTQLQSGEDVSWDAIKAALKEVIDAEDKKSPLSDDALAEELTKRGIEIARRTVAKYRDQLGVPSARLRKAY